jgi:hypothetical protein
MTMKRMTVSERELRMGMNQAVRQTLGLFGPLPVDRLRQTIHPRFRRYLPETLQHLRRRGIIAEADGVVRLRQGA